MGSEAKRKRGGQPGNQNGRVHGLYSKSLTHQEQQYLQSALAIPGIDLDVALLYTKIASILATDPNNKDALYSAISSLDRLLGYDRQKLADILKIVLQDMVGLVGSFPGLTAIAPRDYPERVEPASLPQDESGTN